jgi:hypothetical protein
MIYEQILVEQLMTTAGLSTKPVAPEPRWTVEQLDLLEASAVTASTSARPEVTEAALKLLTRIDEARACLR